MPMLDGKYEILREEHSGDRQTLFEASSPDGTVLRIVWFEVGAEQERSFEQYRRGLKRLMKSGHAAVHDVVARPGAHYVAWYLPHGAVTHTLEPDFKAALEAAGFTREQADIRRSGRKLQVYGLQWADASAGADPGSVSPVAAQATAETRRGSTTIPQSTVTNTIAFGILLLAAVALLGSWYQRTNTGLVTVTGVTGLDVNAAMRELAEIGLHSEPLASPSDEEPGTVVDTSPPAGSQLARGSAVQLRYAFPLGETRPLVVPELTALAWPDEVTAALQGTPLEVGSISRLPSDLPEGSVIAQSEPAGSTVAEGTPLNLLVSAGEPVPSVVLPDLTGLELSEALSQALAAGLPEAQLSILQVHDSTARPGTVVAHEPAAGVEFALEDAQLALEVASGDPEMEPLETFIGMSLPLARSRAEAFDIEVVTVSDTSRPQGVIEQEPPPGSWVDEGRLVLTVNEHPRVIPTPVPGVRVESPGERGLAYSWYIEPGIPQVTARVYATSLDGREQLVGQQTVEGGEWVEGSFDTDEPLVTFRLELNGDPYGEQQRSR